MVRVVVADGSLLEAGTTADTCPCDDATLAAREVTGSKLMTRLPAGALPVDTGVVKADGSRVVADMCVGSTGETTSLGTAGTTALEAPFADCTVEGWDETGC